jgi:hypothetical protein
MKKQTKILILVIASVFVLLIILALYWFSKLQIAHSTFEDYYKFRGCTQLINRTESSGFCGVSSGGVIEIVKYNSKWYLNGDLPGGFLDW